MSTLGQRLKACRKAIKYNQKQVAKSIGISQALVSELEGDHYPTSSYIPHLAKLYGVEALWLATGHGTKDRPDSKTYQLTEQAMKIAIAVNDMPAEYQDALLNLLSIEKAKQDAAKAISQNDDQQMKMLK